MGRHKRRFADDAQKGSLATGKKKKGQHQGREEEIKTIFKNPDATSSTTTNNNSEDKSMTASDVPDLSASTRVFGIYELCEKILMFADLCSLEVFHARAITPTCHAVIFRSIALRHEIFLHRDFTAPAGGPAHRNIVHCQLSRNKRFAINQPEYRDGLTLISRNPFVFGATNPRWCTGALSLSHGFESYVLSSDTNTTIEAMYLFNPPVDRIDIIFVRKRLRSSENTPATSTKIAGSRDATI
ncbi:unnamed protein product [Zymoseptoria tritici ST99CH_3D7]|uniref:Uncharacterized protein n=1 Tax=Zymoseptoria tritici (strain ST99CH_3D7) TaxID=1276538 RepID=A0A1X7RZK6_ZYMT9|nr:unnamed protein product [Zymoseptoria tritici ST99CH_3D7]